MVNMNLITKKEDDYGKIPTYEFDSLSEDEKKIYNDIQ